MRCKVESEDKKPIRSESSETPYLGVRSKTEDSLNLFDYYKKKVLCGKHQLRVTLCQCYNYSFNNVSDITYVVCNSYIVQ